VDRWALALIAAFTAVRRRFRAPGSGGQSHPLMWNHQPSTTADSTMLPSASG
jgi:hypothetical protein